MPFIFHRFHVPYETWLVFRQRRPAFWQEPFQSAREKSTKLILQSSQYLSPDNPNDFLPGNQTGAFSWWSFQLTMYVSFYERIISILSAIFKRVATTDPFLLLFLKLNSHGRRKEFDAPELSLPEVSKVQDEVQPVHGHHGVIGPWYMKWVFPLLVAGIGGVGYMWSSVKIWSRWLNSLEEMGQKYCPHINATLNSYHECLRSS